MLYEKAIKEMAERAKAERQARAREGVKLESIGGVFLTFKPDGKTIQIWYAGTHRWTVDRVDLIWSIGTILAGGAAFRLLSMSNRRGYRFDFEWSERDDRIRLEIEPDHDGEGLGGCWIFEKEEIEKLAWMLGLRG